MVPSITPEVLDHLLTEGHNSSTQNVDLLDTLELCAAFNTEQIRVPHDITRSLPMIASLIDDLIPRLRAGGRLIYVGAGNSGRVGFMDCSELPVTFSADRNQFLTVVAGGLHAIIQAHEGAEDFEIDGAARIEALKITCKDTIIGISASGRTPFVLGALKVALEKNALTAGISNTYPSNISAIGVKYAISVLVGSEFLAGSTRLKAGTAAKEILNMISTCSMIKLGKTYRGLMIDVRVSNNKLKARGRRIIRQICEGHLMHTLDKDGFPLSTPIYVPATAEGDVILDSLIQHCGGSVKLACAVAMSGLAPDVAKIQLDLVDGHFHKFANSLLRCTVPENLTLPQIPELFLTVDGGGTHCTVSIATQSAIVAQATTGACNLNCVSLEELLEQIKLATCKATRSLCMEPLWFCSRRPRFAKVWAGIAGLHHAYKPEILASRLEELFSVSLHDGSLQLTSDNLLLSSCIGIDDSVEGGISIIAGTGSVVTAFKKTSDGKVVQVGRSGGWGHLIGDQGSAFDIGKRAVQAVLTSVEQSQGDKTRQVSDLEREILAHLDCNIEELLSSILHSIQQPKIRIGDLAKVVTKLGFRPTDPDPQALGILTSAANSLVKLVKPLTKRHIFNPSTWSLVLSGALMNLPAYQDLVMDQWTKEKLPLPPLMKVLVVSDASGCAAQFLARQTGTEKESK